MGRMKLALAVTTAAICVGTAAAATIPQVAHTSAGTKLAQASLLRVGDFGSGWTSSAAAGSAPGLSFACPGFTPKQNDITEIGTASSPTFKGDDVLGPVVVQRTSVYATSKSAATLWRRAVTAKLSDCVAQSLQALERQGVGVNITARETIKLGTIGDGSAGYRIVATLIGKSRLKTYYDVIVIRGGPTITQLTISQFQKPVPLKAEIALAKIAARRAGAGGPAA
jgi:hypothetical protein